jgi:FMN-dependent NADH-azoreductase
MKKEENAMLLFVDCCISYRGDRSRSHALCQAFLEEYKRTHPAEDIETVNLQRMALKPFDQFTTDDRNSLRNVKAFDSPIFKLARQFKRADRIVIGAPLRDLTFPAMLRVYIEYICVRELTYHYENQVCVGDCMAEKLAYLSVSGGPETEENLGVDYWRQLTQRFGIKEFYHVDAYGLDFEPERTEEIMGVACDKARALARDF